MAKSDKKHLLTPKERYLQRMKDRPAPTPKICKCGETMRRTGNVSFCLDSVEGRVDRWEYKCEQCGEMDRFPKPSKE